MGKRDDDRILDADEVNRLVRHYSHLHQRQQAAEEWWAGAVALDHFLTGLQRTVEELTYTARKSLVYSGGGREDKSATEHG